ncbi:MAG: LysR family transcriptional regulator [Acetatifactor sp.]|nr:LysR family transcriptional regulator [Acetatifactor sp.]MDE7114334.1 LysR family transcriptional regulator [Acetatifactor sp.]
MIDNLEYFKVFYHVAKAGSVTGAARELAVSQPAVSQAIRQLESQLGADLFYRAAKGVRLTREGQLLFSYVEKGYEQMELGLEKLLRLQNMEGGEIRIGASDMTLQYFLLPYLERFHEKYPDIKMVVTNAPTPETLAFLEEGKIDFGVVSTPFDRQKGLEIVPVREIEDVFVGGRRFIAYKNRTLDLQELESLPMICLEKNTSTRSYMDAYLLQNGVQIQPEFELATSDMIVQFALRSLGVGCVVRDFAAEYLESGVLFALRFNKIIPKRKFCVVRSTKMPLSAAAGRLWADVTEGEML